MAVETDNSRLMSEFESLRLRERKLINDLLALFPKIDNLGEERVSQIRDALFHADHPFLLVFVGPFSSGKSSVINALLGTQDLLRVGPTPTTDHISILRYGDEVEHISGSSDVATVFYLSRPRRGPAAGPQPGDRRAGPGGRPGTSACGCAS